MYSKILKQNTKRFKSKTYNSNIMCKLINIRQYMYTNSNNNIMITERSADKYLYTNMIFQECIPYYTIISLYG